MDYTPSLRKMKAPNWTNAKQKTISIFSTEVATRSHRYLKPAEKAVGIWEWQMQTGFWMHWNTYLQTGKISGLCIFWLFEKGIQNSSVNVLLGIPTHVNYETGRSVPCIGVELRCCSISYSARGFHLLYTNPSRIVRCSLSLLRISVAVELFWKSTDNVGLYVELPIFTFLSQNMVKYRLKSILYDNTYSVAGKTSNLYLSHRVIR